MKISKIQIQGFRQFQNLTLDLTYPLGHPKAGQPLDKVCFIGQNGTGKTTLLKLISDCFTVNHTPLSGIQYEIARLKSAWIGSGIEVRIGATIAAAHQGFYLGGSAFGNRLIHFPTNAYTALINPYKQNVGRGIQVPKNLSLGSEGVNFLSRLFYEQVLKYNNNLMDFSLSLFNQLKKDKNASVGQSIEEWISKNINPLDSLANALDALLAPAGLKLKTDIDKSQQLVDIQLISLKNEEVVPLSEASSGTKNLFWTAVALYQLLEKEEGAQTNFVLMDEPENSLYPDLQRQIIPVYTSLQPETETQFFFATHSPVIAASFEPWEIVDLELDENNFVIRHLYYEGENHVDNYTIYPKYMRWDTILQKVFDMEEDGGAARKSELDQLARLKSQLDYLKSQGKKAKEDPEMGELLDEYKKLMAKLY